MRHHPDGIPPPDKEETRMADLYDMLTETLLSAFKRGSAHVSVAEVLSGVSLLILVGTTPTVAAEYERLKTELPPEAKGH